MSLTPMVEEKTPRPDVPATVYVLGVRVDRCSQERALDVIEHMITDYRESAHQLSCQQIITVNTEFVMMAQHDSIFRQCINQAALVVPDGIGIVWATRYLGQSAPERVTGTDLLPALAKRCAAQGYRLYLLGAAPGVAEVTAEHLQQIIPGLQIAGTYAGSPAVAEEEDILARIRAAEADVLCVAYGAPAQELWIRR